MVSTHRGQLDAQQRDIWERLPDLDARMEIAMRCATDPKARARAMELSKKNKKWWCSAFVYTLDPRDTVEVHELPLILYRFQEDYFDTLDEAAAIGAFHGKKPHDQIVEKSRDMGVSWVSLAWVVHGWLFEPGFNVLIGSRTEALVDDFTDDSLFGRLEFILNRLPGWMLPAGFSIKRHRKQLRIHNPVTGNLIKGEATNRNFGRGSRYRAILFDEAAMWVEPAPLESAWGACSQSTNCRIALSTVNRAHPQNFFYQLRSTVPHVLTLHWRLHPKKDDVWYAEQCARETQDTIRYEIDISYVLSTSGMYYPTWGEVKQGHYPYVPGLPLYTSWDFGFRDTTIIWWQRNPKTHAVYMIDAYQGHDKPIDFYVPLVSGMLPGGWHHTYSTPELRMIATHSLWGQPLHYGDPAGHQHSQTDGKSPIDVLAQDHEIHIQTNPGANTHDQRKKLTELGLRRLHVHSKTCALVSLAMENARYPKRSESSQSTSEPSKPIHDFTSHARSSVEYFFACEALFNPTNPLTLPKPSRPKKQAADALAQRHNRYRRSLP